jgi:DNA-binding transcriptional LysR family regulator
LTASREKIRNGKVFCVLWENHLNHFRQIELFVAVAESGSISRAAEQLELSISAASRYLQALESRLGARLVQRTTRRLSLTEAGNEFLRRARAGLAEIREAEAAVRDFVVEPTGLLRVTASLSFCLLHIEPLLTEFTRRYPEITVDVVVANRYYDIVDNSVDLAIRTREFEADSNLTIRKLAETRRVLAASPAYLLANGVPETPEDLTDHKILVYNYAVHPNELALSRELETKIITIKPFISANDGQVVVRSALHDMGIVVQPKYIVYDELEAGRLVSILDDWDLPRLTMNIAFQTRTYMPAKTRLFIDALIDRFRINDFNRKWTC